MARIPLLPRELHASERPSATAQWTTFGRALELARPVPEQIVSDRFAPAFLSGRSRRLLAPLLLAPGVVHAAERTETVGLAASALARHRFIDDHLLAALPDVAQVLILGAGYDTRAYRFDRSIGSRPVYEVDLAPLSRHKAQLVAARGDLFGAPRITRVEIDFRTEALADRLAAFDFATGVPTFVVWEGVSMYLTRDAVGDTLAALDALCGPGSVLAMDFWQHLGGRRAYDRLRSAGERAIRVVGEPITFMISPDDATRLLGEHGFAIRDLAPAPKMTARYATAGRRCDEGMYVVAADLG